MPIIMWLLFLLLFSAPAVAYIDQSPPYAAQVTEPANPQTLAAANATGTDPRSTRLLPV